MQGRIAAPLFFFLYLVVLAAYNELQARYLPLIGYEAYYSIISLPGGLPGNDSW